MAIGLDTSAKISGHAYKSNWVVGDCRYDIILGLPWHVDCKPIIDYERRQVTVGNKIICSEDKEREDVLPLASIGINQFRKQIKRGMNVEIFQVVSKEV